MTNAPFPHICGANLRSKERARENLNEFTAQYRMLGALIDLGEEAGGNL
jgi:hypothetical protein